MCTYLRVYLQPKTHAICKYIYYIAVVGVQVPDRRGEPRLVPGIITGWLPKDVADFKNQDTGEPAALWRAKLDDKKLDHQDLEEYEVKEALLRYLREEAKKKNEASQVLSSKSMFGQDIKRVYIKLFIEEEEEDVVVPLSDLQPYSQFKEQHEQVEICEKSAGCQIYHVTSSTELTFENLIQEMRRAGKSKALLQVKLANLYLEEHGSAYDKEHDAPDLMRKLGIGTRSEAELSDNSELRAASQHCANFPRILNVVQDNRESMPWITSTKELQVQVFTNICIIYIYIYVYICICVYVCTYIYTNVNKDVYVYIYVYDADQSRSKL